MERIVYLQELKRYQNRLEHALALYAKQGRVPLEGLEQELAYIQRLYLYFLRDCTSLVPYDEEDGTYEGRDLSLYIRQNANRQCYAPDGDVKEALERTIRELDELVIDPAGNLVPSGGFFNPIDFSLASRHWLYAEVDEGEYRAFLGGRRQNSWVEELLWEREFLARLETELAVKLSPTSDRYSADFSFCCMLSAQRGERAR